MELKALDRVKCEERSGFLFRHACLNWARYRCDACGKPVCADHWHGVPWAVLRRAKMVHPDAAAACASSPKDASATACVTCAKRAAKGHGAPPPHDSPYWYSDLHYRGYGAYGPGHWGYALLGGAPREGGGEDDGPDPVDFTAADAASLQAEGTGPDAGFEMEVGGS